MGADEIIAAALADFKRDYGIDLSTDVMVMDRLTQAAERAAREWDFNYQSAEFVLPHVTAEGHSLKFHYVETDGG